LTHQRRLKTRQGEIKTVNRKRREKNKGRGCGLGKQKEKAGRKGAKARWNQKTRKCGKERGRRSFGVFGQGWKYGEIIPDVVW